MKIYTKSGDKGVTSLYDGTRVSKCDVKIEAIGKMDSLISHLGECYVKFIKMRDSKLGFFSMFRPSEEYDSWNDIAHFIAETQGNLMTCNSIIATKNYSKEFPDLVSELEERIDALTDCLPKLTKFILPNNLVHIARTKCRETEILIVELRQDNICHYGEICKYINRLSDYLFQLARLYAIHKGVPEVEWNP